MARSIGLRGQGSRQIQLGGFAKALLQSDADVVSCNLLYASIPLNAYTLAYDAKRHGNDRPAADSRITIGT